MEGRKRELARRWGLNLESEEVQEILADVDRTVQEFIAVHRKATILREFPGEFLGRTLEEAFDSGDSRVRKLLLSTRWRR